MGKIKDLNTIPNLYLILSNEGFENVKISHLGGFWVLLNMDSVDAKEKVCKHVDVGSWFSGLQPAYDSFVCDERITWISIEGLPPKAMTHNTFVKIVSIWGDLTNVEDSESMSLSFKRLCVKIKANVTINDTIKVIMNGKLFWIRIKELEPWSSNFNDEKDDNSISKDESVDNDLENNNDNLTNVFELDNENEIDHVSDSSCMNENDMVFKQVLKSPENPSKSADPFNIYSLLKMNKEEVMMEDNKNNVTSDKSDLNFLLGSHLIEFKGVSSIKSGRSLLDVMDELIKVGHTMGYNMDGCLKNIELIIGSQGDHN
nr:hypothetical protein [Tanacetum cinerariifolium]